MAEQGPRPTHWARMNRQDGLGQATVVTIFLPAP
jgi:hypothetical protein